MLCCCADCPAFCSARADDVKGMLGEKRVFGTAEYHYIQKGFYLDQIERFLKVFPDR